MNRIEEQFYAIAAQEIATKNFSTGLMAKALVDADGDEKKTILNYIRLRVSQQKEEHDAMLKRRKQEEAEKEKHRTMEERIIDEENERLLRNPPNVGNL
jgi:hypothetical protein